MPPRGISTKDAALPANPKWLTIEASDGSPQYWPSKTDPTPDIYGEVDFMQLLDIDHPASIKWRCFVGQSVAEMLNYEDLGSKSWVLKTWPSGYQFYDHNKSKSGVVRHDLYLMGSKFTSKFRSRQEFIPHAYWLMTDPTLNHANCKCKYATGLSQREISDKFGIATQSSTSSQAHVPTNLVSRRGPNNNRRRLKPTGDSPRILASVRRAPKPIKLPKGPSTFVVPEREKDLRAALAPKNLSARRWARVGELVWVKLDQMIGPNEDAIADEYIRFWPGLVEDVLFKTKVFGQRNKDVEMRDITNELTEFPTPEAKSGSSEEKGPETPWSIRHEWHYKIKLLVAEKTVIYGEDHILPYQSYAPCTTLLQVLQSIKVDVDKVSDTQPNDIIVADAPIYSKEESEERFLKAMGQFDPFPDPAINKKARFEDAAGPFAMAVQIASRIVNFWTPTDQWDYVMHAPTAASVSQAINEFSGATRTSMPTRELQALSQQMLGVGRRDSTTITAQTRFQGLWWGAERIWIGELVRLKLTRYQLAPDGATKIAKPSGPGKSSKGGKFAVDTKPDAFLTASTEEVRQNGTDIDTDMCEPDRKPEASDTVLVHSVPSESAGGSGPPDSDQVMTVDADIKAEPGAEIEMRMNEVQNTDHRQMGGAGSRGIFMRVEGIFIVHVPRDDGPGTRNECRMCGMLYELADEDWEPDEEEEEKENEQATKTLPTTPSASIATPLRNLALQPTRTNPLADIYNNASANSTVENSTSANHVEVGSVSAIEVATCCTSGTLFAPNPSLLASPPANQANGPAAPLAATDAPVSVELPPPTIEEISSSPILQHLSEKAKGKQPERAPPPAPAVPQGLNAANPSLSGPLSPAPAAYPLPPAPTTFKFRPILPESHEAVVPITLLSGRYYPGILSNPLMKPFVDLARSDPAAPQNDSYWALEGLVGGVHNAVEATRWKPGRVAMVKEADALARREMVDYWRTTATNSQKHDVIVLGEESSVYR